MYTECETFKRAIKPRYRIIMGRKGSGKTALIKRIRLGSEYDVKVLCKKHELLNWINSSIPEDIAETVPIESYQDECKYFYWLLIFGEVIKQEPALKSVRRFLNEASPPEGSFLGGVKEWALSNLQARSVTVSVSAGIITSFVNIKRATFEDAKKEAIRFLHEKSLIILIDNLEHYFFETAHHRKAFAALLLSAVTFEEAGNVVVKCFLPSEYYTQMEEHAVNWGKISQHITVLRWTEKELISMLCKRLGFKLYLDSEVNFKDLSEFKDLDTSLYFWKRYFPSDVYNEAFQTYEQGITYILRHTQLTPRQVIQLCNSIVNVSDNFPSAVIEGRTIRIGIELWEKQLCKEVFSSFIETYPSAEDFCTEYLRELPMSFRVANIKAEVQQRIGTNKKYKQYKLDYRFLERMLFDLGIVGVGTQAGNPFLSNYNFANFEPNQDGRLIPNPNDDLFVHPMFVHKINFLRDRNAISKPVCSAQLA